MIIRILLHWSLHIIGNERDHNIRRKLRFWYIYLLLSMFIGLKQNCLVWDGHSMDSMYMNVMLSFMNMPLIETNVMFTQNFKYNDNFLYVFFVLILFLPSISCDVIDSMFLTHSTDIKRLQNWTNFLFYPVKNSINIER